MAVSAVLATGCSTAVEGTATAVLNSPGVTMSDDGGGIVAGSPDAGVRIEIYAEPQCTHCATLQFKFGDELRGHLESGRLAVTYRPLTFLDLGRPGYSAAVVDALFLAVDPATLAGQFQAFVSELWANQSLALSRYTNEDFARMATSAGLSTTVSEAISFGRSTVDPDEVTDVNAELLLAIEGDVHTPVVYNLNDDSVIDISDDDWLNDLMRQA
ncbi:thioredoxin domain-containing protein [Mycobacterium sp. ACS4331]|uniref:DsbA family protein n=1 Tax=Mycobacterium sp. ACS4331 TaxID=1834121 RepID=UPI0018D37809|nr:thioredoxin domain-containing protein [Mycobacterium sp. ACS4331]